MKHGAPKSWFADPTAERALRNVERERLEEFTGKPAPLRVLKFRRVIAPCQTPH
jgi:hypothetical protein